jgi:cytochrome c
MNRLCLLVLLIVTVPLMPTAHATGQATPDEAKAMAIKAAGFLKSAGPDKAFPEFTAREGAWHDRDLYVTVTDTKGTVLAHGNNPGLVGHSVIDLKDVDGKPFIRDSVGIPDQGWVDYKWQNPVSKAVEPKTGYYIRVGDYVVGVGAYSK